MILRKVTSAVSPGGNSSTLSEGNGSTPKTIQRRNFVECQPVTELVRTSISAEISAGSAHLLWHYDETAIFKRTVMMREYGVEVRVLKS